MPRWFRKPKNDAEMKQLALARFVRKYNASTLPWQADVLKEWPRVQSAFANVAVRARMPRPPRGAAYDADSEDEVIEPYVDDVPVGPAIDSDEKFWSPSKTEVEAFAKVARCDDLAEILRSSIERNLEFWRWWTTPDGRCPPIGPELFGLVLNASNVRRAGNCGCSLAECRAFVRSVVSITGDLTMTDAFWSDTGVALENFESLLRTACSDCADSTARCRAIPILLRFYTDRLEEHRWLNHQEYGDNTIAFVWEQKLRYLMFQGTRKEGVRICCDSKSTVHVRLRRNGTPHRACFSVLPEHAGDGSLNCWRGGDADRVQCREAAIRLSRRPGDSGGQNRHGFRFIPLPSDFLCRTSEE